MIDKRVELEEEEYEEVGLCTVEGIRDLLEGGNEPPQFTRNDNFRNNSRLRLNLIIFTLIWSTGFFNYYMLNFEMKYIKGNVYVNNMASGISELVSLTMPFCFLEKFGIKLFLLMSLMATIVGGVFMIFLTEYSWAIAFWVLVAKAGASISMNVCQLFPSIVFPSHLRARAYGVVELFARLVLIGAPLVAELKEPLPMVVFASSSAVSFLLVFNINTQRPNS